LEEHVLSAQETPYELPNTLSIDRSKLGGQSVKSISCGGDHSIIQTMDGK